MKRKLESGPEEWETKKQRIKRQQNEWETRNEDTTEPANSGVTSKGTKDEEKEEAEAVHMTGTSEAPYKQQPKPTAEATWEMEERELLRAQ